MLGPEETSTALAGTPEGSGEVAVAAAAHAPDGAVARGAFGTLPMQQLMGHLLRSHDLSRTADENRYSWTGLAS